MTGRSVWSGLICGCDGGSESERIGTGKGGVGVENAAAAAAAAMAAAVTAVGGWDSKCCNAAYAGWSETVPGGVDARVPFPLPAPEAAVCDLRCVGGRVLVGATSCDNK